MKYKKILLTGGSGKLGHAIIKSGYFPEIILPPHKILDITKPKNIEKFLAKNDFGAIIHCAALARMAECEKDPVKAVNINIIGTCNLVNETIKRNQSAKRDIRFIYISTDGVYPGTKGNYSEKDETIPYNKYGWTKLGGECAVRILSNYCIIRTSFFDPNNIRFDVSATDSYSSKVTIQDLIKAVSAILDSNFTGTINIGSDRKSDFERYKQFKPALKPCKLQDIVKRIGVNLAHDSSLNLELWKKLNRKINKSKIQSGKLNGAK